MSAAKIAARRRVAVMVDAAPYPAITISKWPLGFNRCRRPRRAAGANLAALPREPFRPILRVERGAGAKGAVVPLFLIERNFAEIVETDPERMATIKQVNDEIRIQWLFSLLSADKIKTYCLYEAPSPRCARRSAKALGLRPG